MNHTWTLGNSVIQSRQDYWTVSVLHTIARPIINSLPFFCKVRKTLAFERNLHFGLVYSAIIACVHLRKGQTQFVPYLQIVVIQGPFVADMDVCCVTQPSKELRSITYVFSIS